VGPFGLDRGGLIGDLVAEEVVAGETGVALTTLRVEDPESRSPPRRAVAVAGDERFGPLADDVATEPDPRPSGELETDTGRLGDGRGQTTRETRWFEDDEERLRASSECRQTTEPVGDAGRAIRSGEATTGQIEDEQVDRSTGQQRATDGQTLIQCFRRDHDEPLEADPAGDRLDRVETAREVQPGHDRALRLGLRREPQDEGRPTARSIATDRDTGRSGQAAGPEDGVEGREPGADDTVIGGR